MKNFNYVAIVNLLEDYHKKNYAFALYEEDLKLINKNSLVVVNPKNEDNRVIGTIKDIIPFESYEGANITRQVVGIVNMDGYTHRKEKEDRLKKIAKKVKDIEKELKKEINKRKSIEYYEEMANKYYDNPKLKELVDELKCLKELSND